MGFVAPDLPDLDHDEWSRRPYSERLKPLAQHWVEHGFGTPSAIYLVYVLKIGLYVAGAAWFISMTPGLGGLGDDVDVLGPVAATGQPVDLLVAGVGYRYQWRCGDF